MMKRDIHVDGERIHKGVRWRFGDTVFWSQFQDQMISTSKNTKDQEAKWGVLVVSGQLSEGAAKVSCQYMHSSWSVEGRAQYSITYMYARGTTWFRNHLACVTAPYCLSQ